MANLKQKLASRKLWMAIAGIFVGIVIAFGGDPETIERVAGSMITAITAISYIAAEAGIDKAAASTPITIVSESEGTDAEDH